VGDGSDGQNLTSLMAGNPEHGLGEAVGLAQRRMGDCQERLNANTKSPRFSNLAPRITMEYGEWNEHGCR
jgi:hypothetical protein